jgi:hypothetical protein
MAGEQTQPWLGNNKDAIIENEQSELIWVLS